MKKYKTVDIKVGGKYAINAGDFVNDCDGYIRMLLSQLEFCFDDSLQDFIYDLQYRIENKKSKNIKFDTRFVNKLLQLQGYCARNKIIIKDLNCFDEVINYYFSNKLFYLKDLNLLILTKE